MFALLRRRRPPRPRKRAKQAQPVPYLHDDDTRLLNFSIVKGRAGQGDAFRLGDAYTGYLALGSTGSGKTSAARSLALSYLRIGMGGLVLSAKASQPEWDNWQQLASQSDRQAQLIRFDEQGVYRFNFLDYAAHLYQDAQGQLITASVVDLLLRMSRAAMREEELHGQAPEQPFWKLAPRELVSHTLDALWAAYGRLRLNDIIQFVVSVPADAAEFANPQAQASSFCLQTLHKAAHDPARAPDPQDLFVIIQYFRDNFTRLDARTRTNITVTMTSQFAPFQKGLMHRLFCTHTTVVPELTHEGAIIVLDLPVDRYGSAGSMAAFILKYCWQQAALRRDTTSACRPIFLWADEAQYFVGEEDMKFQSVARSARACTVYLTQTISNFYAVMGGAGPRDSTAAFLANFVTKVFHRNDDTNTNEFASQLIGRELQLRGSHSKGFNSGEGYSSGDVLGDSHGFSSADHSSSFNRSHNRNRNSGMSASSGFSSNETQSEQMDVAIEPNLFTRLANGRKENRFLVDAILFQGGRQFQASGGRPYLKTQFFQGVK